MILRNYYKAIAQANMGCKIADLMPVNFSGTTTTINSIKCNFTDDNGYAAVYMGRLNTGDLHYQKTGIIIGSGSTPATFDDYKLENRIVADTASTITLTSGTDENGMYISALITITNNSSEAFTVAECGVHGAFSSGASEANFFLVDRTVLETPITIEAGGVGQVTYTIRMNYPTA